MDSKRWLIGDFLVQNLIEVKLNFATWVVLGRTDLQTKGFLILIAKCIYFLNSFGVITALSRLFFQQMACLILN